ncbi:MAG: 16S rRNA (guanine(527)-N(7))-methyltransferase RsmG, partial [Gammaproteobacteria bacterium]
MNTAELKELLLDGLSKMDIYVPEQAPAQLLTYLALLHKWNQAYNLTAVDEPKEMVIRHLLDCLVVLPYLAESSPILDVGSGAGLPGMVLAIARPEQQFYLLDSLGKRTIFLEKVTRELKLKNVTVVNSRIEQYQPGMVFAAIISRAFSSLSAFFDNTAHLADKNTAYIALKGRLQVNEINEIKEVANNIEIHELQIPMLNAERHLI